MSRLRTTVCPLRSGSSGNSVLIAGRSTKILIDAGVSCRTIERAMRELDHEPDQLNALLVTHEHSDHISGIGVLMRRYRLPLYVNHKTWQAMRSSVEPVDESLVHIFETDRSLTIGDFDITPFSTPHDAADSVGYRIKTDDGDVALMTDIGCMNGQLLQQAAGSQVVLIESNYDPAMLQAGRYPAFLKERVSSSVGHLSNDDCARAIADLLQLGTNRFILSHLSAENNYPELALLTVGRHLNTIQAAPGKDATVTVARRYSVSESICL